MLGRWLWILGSTAVLMVVALTLIAAAIVASEPLVPTPATASPAQVQQARSAAKRTLRVLTRATTPTRVQVSATELAALPSLIARAYPRLATRFTPEPGALAVAASLTLPTTPFGRFLSVSARVVAAPELQLQRVQIGTLTLPDSLTTTLLSPLLNALVGRELSQQLRQNIQLEGANTRLITLRITPPEDPQQQFSQLMQRYRDISGIETPFDRALIARYYQQLLDQAARTAPEQWVSLTYFVAPLFREVARHAPAGDEHRHCGAAILALALYLGSDQFEQLTGPVLTGAMRQARTHHRTVLRGRADLRLHFIYSAALQVLAEQGLSYALGEFKELLDSNRGGSGFSFADLAADRAGTLFALRATADAAQARTFLDRFGPPLREGDLMIPIHRLPEGLTEEAFTAAYRDIDGAGYQALVARIDSSLMSLRLYQVDAQEL